MSSKPLRAEPGVGMRLALDLGPLAVYFAAFSFSDHNIYLATGLFMAVTAVAMIVSLIRFGKVSPIQIFSAVMVLIGLLWIPVIQGARGLYDNNPSAASYQYCISSSPTSATLSREQVTNNAVSKLTARSGKTE